MLFDTVLVANRGEIACRIIRACHEHGLKAVAVFAEDDHDSLFVSLADRAVALGGRVPADTYLSAERLLAAARDGEAGAVHPGYGFLAENAAFARAVQSAGLIWIGPEPDTMERMGDKDRARGIAAGLGVPVLRGSRRLAPADAESVAAEGVAIGFPLLVKATGGGGGIGMRVVDSVDRLEAVVAATQAQARRFFGDDGILLEPFLSPARHVEVQVFGFGDGRAVHLYERDCSIQRRFQKIVEEAPAPALPETVRRAMTEGAIRMAQSQRYSGAGTVEFLYHAATERFFFLEMNTRIQVEHGVSEMVTGLDLVGLQLRLANGEDLSSLTQDSIASTGHAIEVRLCAEDPRKDFRPSPGRLRLFELPASSPDLRIDTGYRAGDTLSPLYDSLLAKVICRGETRAHAVSGLSGALGHVRVDGLMTNLDYLRALLAAPAFLDADVHTAFVDAHGPKTLLRADPPTADPTPAGSTSTR